MKVLRHLLSILLLPFTAVVVVPWALIGSNAAELRYGMWELPSRIAGGVAFVLGFSLFCWCVLLFAQVGRGTLAPWDPTQALVSVGPYRYTRNPMITAVASMLFGEGLWTRAAVLLGWAALFVVVNHVYFVGVEEPGLERRFGAGYARYKASVPRWLPRLNLR